jgi:small GTP-binding protein
MDKSFNSGIPHIAIIGKRNVGKSSLINALGDKKNAKECHTSEANHELLRTIDFGLFGLFVMIGTAGIDDIRDSGNKKTNQTTQVISAADFIIVVIDARETLSVEEVILFDYLKKNSLPFLAAVNKIDCGINPTLVEELSSLGIFNFEISCKEMVGIEELKTRIIRMLPS